MPHFMEFASWLWSIDEKPENAHLYLRPGEHVHLCDLRAEFTRWDRMYARDARKWPSHDGMVPQRQSKEKI